jgi:hypothetical protein
MLQRGFSLSSSSRLGASTRHFDEVSGRGIGLTLKHSVKLRTLMGDTGGQPPAH